MPEHGVKGKSEPGPEWGQKTILMHFCGFSTVHHGVSIELRQTTWSEGQICRKFLENTGPVDPLSPLHTINEGRGQNVVSRGPNKMMKFDPALVLFIAP